MQDSRSATKDFRIVWTKTIGRELKVDFRRTIYDSSKIYKTTLEKKKRKTNKKLEKQ